MSMRIGRWTALWVLIFMTAFFGCAAQQAPEVEAEPAMMEEAPAAQSAPAVSLEQYQGQVVVLNFFATWCPHCQNEVSELNEINNKYGDQGLVVVGMALDEGPAAGVLAEARSMGMNYPVYAGATARSLARQMGGVSSFPTTFLLDRQGRVETSTTGTFPASQWDDDIQNLL